MANVTTYTMLGLLTGFLLNGSGTAPKYVSWGTGAGTSARTDTALFTEMYSSQNNGTGNQRVTGTVTQQTTSQTNDTLQVVATLTSTTSQTITNCGLFDTVGTSANLTTAPSGGNLYCQSDFTGVALNTSDSIQFTLKLTFT